VPDTDQLLAGVAVVDNAPVLRKLLKETAERLGSARLFVLENADELFSLLHAGGIGKVFCDWRMPRRSGIDVLMQVRRSRPEVRCVLLTGWQQDLTPSEKATLAANHILVEDKDMISEAWVAAELGLLHGEERPAHPGDEPQGEEDPFPESLPEALAVTRLERDTLKSVLDRQKSIIGKVAEGLVGDLSRIPPRRRVGLFGSGRGMTVDHLIEHIRGQTEFGLRLLEIDRKMQLRYRSRK